MYVITTILYLFCRSILVSAISLMPILGSTWIIGVFAVNEHTEVFAWIFTILNSLQVCLLVITILFKYVFNIYIYLFRDSSYFSFT